MAGAHGRISLGKTKGLNKYCMQELSLPYHLPLQSKLGKQHGFYHIKGLALSSWLAKCFPLKKDTGHGG